MLKKYLRVISAFMHAFVILWFVFPRASREEKLTYIQTWSSQFLKLLDIHLSMKFLTDHAQTPTSNLLISNHVSWLDILVIQSVYPSVFVAKLEVKRWPMIGHLATACGVIFVDRSSTQSAHKMVVAVAAALHHGYNVTGFPEGTSSTGHKVKVFHTNIFESAIKSNCLVMPLSLRYTHAHSGALCNEAAFEGELGFLASLHRVIKTKQIDASLKIGPTLSPQGHSRRTLAHLTHQHVAMQLEAASMLKCSIHTQEVGRQLKRAGSSSASRAEPT